MRLMKVMNGLREIAAKWPLTGFGNALAIFSLCLWPVSVMENNRAGLILSLCGLALSTLAILATHLGQPPNPRQPPSPVLREGMDGASFSFDLRSIKLFPLLHLCFEYRMRLLSSGTSLFSLYRLFTLESLALNVRSLNIPTNGILELDGGYLVMDSLRISKRRIGARLTRHLPVYPAFIPGFLPHTAIPSANADERANKKRAEGERILVREYVAGDLPRDVNWKALLRTGQLLTRIPPEAPKEDRLITLFVIPPEESLTGSRRVRRLIELACIRSLVVTFIQAARSMEAGSTFSIELVSGEGTGEQVSSNPILIEENGDLDGVLTALSSLTLLPLQMQTRPSFSARSPRSVVFSCVSSELLRRSISAIRESGSLVFLSRYSRRGENTVSLLAGFPLTRPSLGFAGGLAFARFLPAESDIPLFEHDEIVDCGVGP